MTYQSELVAMFKIVADWTAQAENSLPQPNLAKILVVDTKSAALAYRKDYQIMVAPDASEVQNITRPSSNQTQTTFEVALIVATTYNSTLLDDLEITLTRLLLKNQPNDLMITKIKDGGINGRIHRIQIRMRRLKTIGVK